MLSQENQIPDPWKAVETRAPEELEALVRRRTAALRSVSARLLRVQDEERRRLARELHDSTGQILTALKIQLAILQERTKTGHAGPVDFAHLNALADQAIQDIRTTSYLLFPPLLEEQGFCSAAKWYVEGFSDRSKITVRLNLDPIGRLSSVIETTFFRILQESLANIYRHSRSRTADVWLKLQEKRLILDIRDYGDGMPSRLLQQFEEAGASAGVGLAGMKERIEECDGKLEVLPGDPGTLIRATVPFESREMSSLGRADCGKAIAA